jgi:copper(I)-binding protein
MRRTLLAIIVVAAGCSGGDSAGLSVEDPWVRPSPNVATNAAFFLTLENTGDAEETLVSASSEACRVTELHESTMTDGVMSMQQVAGGISIPASQTVLLQPGGLHVMCIDKTVDFAEGEEIELSLEFLSGDGTTHVETVSAVVEDR